MKNGSRWPLFGLFSLNYKAFPQNGFELTWSHESHMGHFPASTLQLPNFITSDLEEIFQEKAS
jgi:hypothetical protein